MKYLVPCSSIRTFTPTVIPFATPPLQPPLSVGHTRLEFSSRARVFLLFFCRLSTAAVLLVVSSLLTNNLFHCCSHSSHHNRTLKTTATKQAEQPLSLTPIAISPRLLGAYESSQLLNFHRESTVDSCVLSISGVPTLVSIPTRSI